MIDEAGCCSVLSSGFDFWYGLIIVILLRIAGGMTLSTSSNGTASCRLLSMSAAKQALELDSINSQRGELKKAQSYLKSTGYEAFVIFLSSKRTSQPCEALT